MNRRTRRSSGASKPNQPPRPIHRPPPRPRRSATPEILVIVAAFAALVLADYLLRSSLPAEEPATSYAQHDEGPDAPDLRSD